MFPSGGTPVLAAAPLPAQGTNFLRSQRSDCQRAFDEDPYQYSMQQLGQGPIAAATGYTEVVDLGGWVVVVGHEPVHDSLHVTYRLLAPGTEPSRGPQPIKLHLI